jgi:hypothetical protein
MKPLLLSAVMALAQPPEEQAATLREMRVDELALDLDAQPWHEEPEPLRTALNQLDALLDSMSGPDNAHLWTLAALPGPEWDAVRQAARRALAIDTTSR